MTLENRVKTGIAGLDEILEGGFLPGSSVLLEGAPGTGKTNLGLQILYREWCNLENRHPGQLRTIPRADFPRREGIWH
jgi:predicted ATP-dependent serine protease